MIFAHVKTFLRIFFTLEAQKGSKCPETFNGWQFSICYLYVFQTEEIIIESWLNILP